MRFPILYAVPLMLTGCFDLAGSPSRDEVASATSPDGSLRAALFETNGGATTSYGYEIELAPTSQTKSDPVVGGTLYGAARSECSYGVNLRWLSPTELGVEFMEADRAAIPATVKIGEKTVTMTTRSGVSDETAPCGGMFANRG
jgi:hypothetical protein